MTPPSLGFIGFGEAASAMAGGLRREGLEGIVAFDKNLDDAARRKSLDEKAEAAGVRLVPSFEELVQGRDVVVSAVTVDTAMDVATVVAPRLDADSFFVDINSLSPERKRRIADLLGEGRGKYVEAAVMAAVRKFEHKVPILLGGPWRRAFMELMAPYGMRLEDAGPDYGTAAAIKMFRSIMVKGLEGLLWECVLAADRYGAAERVLNSFEEGYPGIDWNALASHLIGRTVAHGERRANELDEVAATLRHLGIDPFMAEAAAERIRWTAPFGLKEAFGDHEPESYTKVLAKIRAFKEQG